MLRGKIMLRQKEPQPEICLPPAKLYLDDIEQIIRILTEALGTEQDSTGGVEPVELLFQIHDHTTDVVLPTNLDSQGLVF
jgi:hypothetical protein